MAFLSGSTGHIRFAKSTSVDPEANDSEGTGWQDETNTRITNWTLNSTAELLDTTTLGVYDRSSVYGLRSATGTLRLFYYTNSTVASGNVVNNSASWFFSALVRAANPQVNDSFLPPNALSIESIPIFLRLYVNKTQSIKYDDYVEFKANINSVSIGSNVGELVALDVSFTTTEQIERVRL